MDSQLGNSAVLLPPPPLANHLEEKNSEEKKQCADNHARGKAPIVILAQFSPLPEGQRLLIGRNCHPRHEERA